MKISTVRQLESLAEGRKKHLLLSKCDSYWTKERRDRWSKVQIGKSVSDETKKRMSESAKKSMTKERIKKMLIRRPMSGLEIKVDNVIKKYKLPYKFVGNGKFFIEKINPDFVNINGKKIAVEVFWKRHKEQFRNKTIQEWMDERINIAKKYGWQMLFIEGTGLKNSTIIKQLQFKKLFSKGGELI